MCILIRTFFGLTVRQCPERRPPVRVPVLAPMGALLAAYAAGDITTQCDLVAGAP